MSTSAPYLKQGANGNWYVHWTESRVGKRVSTRTKDLPRAKEFFAAWMMAEQKDAAATLGHDLTLADVWKVYKLKHVDRKVAGVYNADLAWKTLEPHFGHVFASALSQMTIDDYMEKRTTGRHGRKVKPQTVGKELSYLLAAVAFCGDERRKVIDGKFVKKFDLPAPGEPRDRWLTHVEIQRMLTAAAALRRGPRLSRGERFLWIALETAARKEAILDLTWDRVDFETGVMTLDVPGRVKTKKRRATVPMSKSLRPIMERAFAERDKKDPANLVMDNKGAVWATIQNIAVEAGFGGKRGKLARGTKPKATGISPHVLRHTAATHMARRGVSLWMIAKVLGNTIAVVERTYAKHQPADLLEAVDLISNGVLEAAE